jgi:acetyl-CoA/propionyl-CoA carboxylase biotin carboxyl carrier protein
MEMNTRLQVEHPVTELVTGLDLVEQQLRIAAGEPLAFGQADVTLTGHAVEARVYAEDPERGFLPAGGRVLALREPSGAGVRVDSGLAAGIPIVTDYDPMLAKVIAWGTDRGEALARLRGALAGTSILGSVTNVAWLRDLVSDPDVVAGRMDTTLIDSRFSDAQPAPVSDEELIAAALIAHADRTREAPSAVGPLWGAPSGWRLGRPRPVRYDVDGMEVAVAGEPEDATVTVGTAAPARASLRLRPAATDGEPHVALLSVDGVTVRFDLARDGDTIWLARDGRARALRLRDRATRLAERLAAVERGESAAHPELRSPMPGTVVAVPVADGARVASGDTVVVVEAMKMEHRLVAPAAGTVTVQVAPGDLVRLDQVVARVDADEPSTPSTPTDVPPEEADAAPAPPAAAQR